jgi:hypothetical protein
VVAGGRFELYSTFPIGVPAVPASIVVTRWDTSQRLASVWARARLAKLRGLELKDDGEYEVVLNSNVRLRLSRRFRKALQDRLGVARRSAGD